MIELDKCGSNPDFYTRQMQVLAKAGEFYSLYGPGHLPAYLIGGKLFDPANVRVKEMLSMAQVAK